MAVNIRLIQLYVDVINKAIVSIGGSPSAVPALYYGDKPTFQIFPVMPTGSVGAGPLSGGNYAPVSLAAFTMNLTLGPAPDATAPNASIASLDGMAWDATTGSFIGTVDLTTVTVQNFIGAAPSNTCWICFDVFDATLNRTTLYQSTSANITIWASIDTPATGPAGPTVQYLTVQQALNLFVQIGAFPGKFIEFQSPDGSKLKTLSANNDGSEGWA